MPAGKYIRKIKPLIIPIGPSIAYVPLGNKESGKFALIDSADADLVGRFNWSCFSCGKSWYVYRGGHATNAVGVRSTLLHREILGLRHGDRRTGDHRNLNPLDNRRSNLRIATREQQCANRGVRRGNKCGVKGVYKNASGRYVAQIARWSKGERATVYLGSFLLLMDAAAVYSEEHRRRNGEFSRT